MRDKLIELIKSRRDPCDIGACPFTVDDVRPCSLCEAESLAEHLIANGVTFAEDNNVPCKKPVLYSVTRGALCPACDGTLDIEVTVKKFLRKEKRYTLRHQSNCCKHCGQPLDWGNEPPKEVNDELQVL